MQVTLSGFLKEKKVMSDSSGLVDFFHQTSEFCALLAQRASEDFWRIIITEVLQKCFKFLINSCRPKITRTK